MTQFKQGNKLMYAFINTPAKLQAIIEDCELEEFNVFPNGSMQIYGEDLTFPNVIHYYLYFNPKMTDPYRLFILGNGKTFEYKEVL